MAGEKEKTTESVGETPTKQLSQPSDARDALLKLAQILLPIAGIFTALSYFLGRLHIEAYYYALGITPHVLDFKPEDYMFSSFNLVIMCFAASYWLYLYWGWARAGTRLVLGLPIAKGQARSELINDMAALIFVFLWWGFLIWMFFIKNIGANIPGITGLNAGFIIGIGGVLFAWFLQTFFGRGRKLDVLGMFIIALYLVSMMPFITTRLAEIEAKNDVRKFPQAVLVCEDALPTELQSSPSTPTESSEVKLIITNNGMTYVLKQDSEATDKWQIYAIQENDIKQIIYLHGK